MRYTVMRVDGDYLVLKSDNGDESLLARALCPDADEGDTLVYENFAYRVE